MHSFYYNSLFWFFGEDKKDDSNDQVWVVHFHSYPFPPLLINISPQLEHIILPSPRSLTVSSFPLPEKGKRQPHFLHLM